MDASLSMKALKNLFAFPFQDRAWQQKFLIGSVLIIAAMYIPIIPFLPVLGYIAILIRQAWQADLNQLPEWADWGNLFKNGLRLFGVTFSLSLPSMLVMILGLSVYFATTFGMVFSTSTRESSYGPSFLLLMVGMAIYFVSLALTMLLSIMGGIMTPPALAHVSITGHFRTFFSTDWWKVIHANPLGFFLAFFVMVGLFGIEYVLIMVLYMTMILCIFIPFLFGPLLFYTLLLGAIMTGQAYRDAMQKLNSADAHPQPVPVTTDSTANSSEGAA